MGNTFGDHNLIKEEVDYYQGYNKNDKGYLIQLESHNEAKFLANNNLFHKMIWRSNLLNQEPDEPLIKSIRFENLIEDKPSKVEFDEYGFEIKEDVAKSMLPVFLPFNELKNEKENEPDHFSKACEYYIFSDMNAILNRDQIKMFLSHYKDPVARHERRISPTLKKPDLNSLKKYTLEQQKLHFIRLNEIHHANAHSKMR